jgi:hypothetical protein
MYRANSIAMTVLRGMPISTRWPGWYRLTMPTRGWFTLPTRCRVSGARGGPRPLLPATWRQRGGRRRCQCDRHDCRHAGVCVLPWKPRRCRSQLVCLEPVRVKPAGFLVHDVPGEIQHVLCDFDVLDVVKIFGRVADFVWIAQQSPHQALV